MLLTGNMRGHIRV